MTYNGWTNWETWMINLHFDGFFDDHPDGDTIKDVVETMVDEMHDGNLLLQDIINGCLSEVNWNEIAEHYMEAA